METESVHPVQELTGKVIKSKIGFRIRFVFSKKAVKIDKIFTVNLTPTK